MTLEGDGMNGTRSPFGKSSTIRSNVQVLEDACNGNGNIYQQTTNVSIDKGILAKVIKFYSM